MYIQDYFPSDETKISAFDLNIKFKFYIFSPLDDLYYQLIEKLLGYNINLSIILFLVILQIISIS